MFYLKENGMKQLTVIGLIWKLFGILIWHGNKGMYFHICGHPESFDCPMEVELIEVRKSNMGDKITIT